MDRNQLIRANFNAYRDLTWVKELEPRFRPYRLSAAELKAYRDAWNRYTEARDWAWWLDNAKETSDATLRQEIAACKAEIDALRQQSPSQEGGVTGTLAKQLGSANSTAQPKRPTEPERTH